MSSDSADTETADHLPTPLRLRPSHPEQARLVREMAMTTLVSVAAASRYTVCRDVRNPMNISDIGFLKTEPTSKFKNRTPVSAVRFSKTDIHGFGTVFHVVLFTIRNSKPPALQPSHTLACPGQEGRCTHSTTGDCW